jgi:hypothetical protein
VGLVKSTHRTFAVLLTAAMYLCSSQMPGAETVCPTNLSTKPPLGSGYCGQQCKSENRQCFAEWERCNKERDRLNDEIYKYNQLIYECSAAFEKKGGSKEAVRPSQPSNVPRSAGTQNAPAGTDFKKLLEETKKQTESADVERQRQRTQFQTDQIEIKNRNEAERIRQQQELAKERAAEKAAADARERQRQIDQDRTRRELAEAAKWHCFDTLDRCARDCTRNLGSRNVWYCNVKVCNASATGRYCYHDQ